MFFNSIEFLIFFPCVLCLYWLLTKEKYRQICLILASIFFYSQFSFFYLGLLVFSIIVDYNVALAIHRRSTGRAKFLVLSVLVNFLPLVFFKISPSLSNFLHPGNLRSQLHELRLPLGMSFYTFKSVGYIIDVYRGSFSPTKSFKQYFLFVSFFPSLLSGPISRFNDFFPRSPDALMSIDYVLKSTTLVIFGFAKKICFADPIHKILQNIWPNLDSGSLGWINAATVTVAVSVQLYCDFSGYSDIAKGVAGLLGYQVPRNFFFPYLSCDVGEFWRRQHITMSLWFRDYVFYPILVFFRRLPTRATLAAIVATFLLSGLWHGLTDGCLIFGCLHVVYMLTYHFSRNRLSLRFPINWLVTQALVAISILYLLSPSVAKANDVLYGFSRFAGSYFIEPQLAGFCSIFLIAHCVAYWSRKLAERAYFPPMIRSIGAASYMAFLLSMTVIFSSKSVPFIYYQF